MQEYLGRAEGGHIALVSGGEIHSLFTNQEYKYAFNGNMGIVAAHRWAAWSSATSMTNTVWRANSSIR